MPHFSRRRVLRSAATGAAAVLVVGPVSACGLLDPPDPAPTRPDPLLPAAARARADAVFADTVASTHPELAARSTVLAADRTAHAVALDEEIRRAAAAFTAPSSTPSGSVAVAPAPVPPDPAAAADALNLALDAARDEAVELVTAAAPFRAGLLASIAACCASHRAVTA